MSLEHPRSAHRTNSSQSWSDVFADQDLLFCSLGLLVAIIGLYLAAHVDYWLQATRPVIPDHEYGQQIFCACSNGISLGLSSGGGVACAIWHSLPQSVRKWCVIQFEAVRTTFSSSWLPTACSPPVKPCYEEVPGAQDLYVHRNQLLERWIAQDAEDDKRKGAELVADVQSSELANIISAPKALALTDLTSESHESLVKDADTEPSALAQLRAALARSLSMLRGLLNIRAPYLDDVSDSFRDSIDRELIAQLPDWMKLGPRNVRYSAGRLENGCYLVQIPGQPAMHLNLERKTFVSLGGIDDAKMTEAAKRAITGA